jgi:hypothetical protein
MSDEPKEIEIKWPLADLDLSKLKLDVKLYEATGLECWYDPTEFVETDPMNNREPWLRQS